MNLNALDLNKLRVFCTVVEMKGYRYASEKLNLTRSALSQAISILEGQLQKPLFNRVGTKMIATHEANTLYQAAKLHLSNIESAVQAFQGLPTESRGFLKVGAHLEFTKNRLMPAITHFISKNPHIQIQFVFDSPSRLARFLEHDRIDLSISVFPHKARGILCQRLQSEELCLVGPKKLISRNPSARELSQVPVIDYFPTHSLFRKWWAIHFKKPPQKIFTRAYASTAEMILELVRGGHGVGVVPRTLIEEAGNLHFIEPTSKKMINYHWLSTKKRKTTAPLVELFTQQLISNTSRRDQGD